MKLLLRTVRKGFVDEETVSLHEAEEQKMSRCVVRWTRPRLQTQDDLPERSWLASTALENGFDLLWVQVADELLEDGCGDLERLHVGPRPFPH